MQLNNNKDTEEVNENISDGDAKDSKTNEIIEASRKECDKIEMAEEQLAKKKAELLKKETEVISLSKLLQDSCMIVSRIVYQLDQKNVNVF